MEPAGAGMIEARYADIGDDFNEKRTSDEHNIRSTQERTYRLQSETRMGADGKFVTLEDADCIHLTWVLDNAQRELQITCTFRDKWLDIRGFSDINGNPAEMSERGVEEVIRFLNEVNSHSKFGCAFYLDTQTNDIACTGRIPYSLLEWAPNYVVNIIDGIWEFFSDVGDELMAVAKGELASREVFHPVIDKGLGE